MHISLISLNPSLTFIKLEPPLSHVFFSSKLLKRRVHPQYVFSYNNLDGYGPQCSSDIPLLMVISDSLLILK